MNNWPEKIVKADGVEVLDTSPEFAELKKQFLASEKHTQKWVLVQTRMGLGNSTAVNTLE